MPSHSEKKEVGPSVPRGRERAWSRLHLRRTFCLRSIRGLLLSVDTRSTAISTRRYLLRDCRSSCRRHRQGLHVAPFYWPKCGPTRRQFANQPFPCPCRASIKGRHYAPFRFTHIHPRSDLRSRWADAASPSGWRWRGSFPGWLAPGTCVLQSRSHACYSKQPRR